MSDEETPIAEATEATDEPSPQRLEAPGPVLQLVFHAPDGSPLMAIGCPQATMDEQGVHLPALVVLQQLFAHYTVWQNAQPSAAKPSGILVPNGHAPLSVAQQNEARLRSVVQQLRPRPGKRSH